MNVQAIERELRNLYAELEKATSHEQRNGIFTDYAQRIADMEHGEVVSLTEAAEMLGVTRQRVHILLQNGKLNGYKVGNAWSVYKASVEQRVGDMETI